MTVTYPMLARLPDGGLNDFDAHEETVLPLPAASGAIIELLAVRDVR